MVPQHMQAPSFPFPLSPLPYTCQAAELLPRRDQEQVVSMPPVSSGFPQELGTWHALLVPWMILFPGRGTCSAGRMARTCLCQVLGRCVGTRPGARSRRSQPVPARQPGCSPAPCACSTREDRQCGGGRLWDRQSTGLTCSACPRIIPGLLMETAAGERHTLPASRLTEHWLVKGHADRGRGNPQSWKGPLPWRRAYAQATPSSSCEQPCQPRMLALPIPSERDDKQVQLGESSVRAQSTRCHRSPGTQRGALAPPCRMQMAQESSEAAQCHGLWGASSSQA